MPSIEELVVVLEDSALPEIGDLFYDRFAMIAFPLDETLIKKWNDKPDGEIIQRNGRPVIYKSALEGKS